MRTLLAFTPLMLRDFLLTRGAAMVVVLLTFLLPPLLFDDRVRTPLQHRAMALSTLQAVSVFLTLIAAYGTAGQDFRSGSFRVLFSRPVSVPAYYVVVFLCSLVGFWLVLALGMFTFLIAEIDAWSGPVLLDLTFQFLLLGSVIFVFSRMTRLGWIVGYMFFVLGTPMRDAYPAGETWYGTAYNVVLPPSQLLRPAGQGPSREISALLPSIGPEWWDMVWVGGYSLAALAVGVILLRVVPLVWAQ